MVMFRYNSNTACHVLKSVFNAVVAGLVLAMAIKTLCIMTETEMFQRVLMVSLFTASAVLGSLSKGQNVKEVVLSIGWGTAWGMILVGFGLEFIIPILTFALITLILIYYESYRAQQAAN